MRAFITHIPCPLLKRGLGLCTQVGVLHDWPSGGRDKWDVVWANGEKGTYCAGDYRKFELCHVEVCADSGAPVLWSHTFHGDAQQLRRAAEAGAAVVRGTQWAARDGGSRAEWGRLQKVDTRGKFREVRFIRGWLCIVYVAGTERRQQRTLTACSLPHQPAARARYHQLARAAMRLPVLCESRVTHSCGKQFLLLCVCRLQQAQCIPASKGQQRQQVTM